MANGTSRDKGKSVRAMVNGCGCGGLTGGVLRGIQQEDAPCAFVCLREVNKK
jgi:cysteine synthase